MKLNYDFDRMITLGKKILGDSWNIQYVNVETVAYELRAYKGLSMCVIVVEDEDFDDPLVNYYEYKKGGRIV